MKTEAPVIEKFGRSWRVRWEGVEVTFTPKGKGEDQGSVYVAEDVPFWHQRIGMLVCKNERSL